MTKLNSRKSEELLRFEKLAMRFERRQIFKSIEHRFYEGECYLLTGRNGSGKSTLLRVMSGLLKPNEGEITFFKQQNQSVRSWNQQKLALRHQVMYLHQNPYLFDGTVLKNLEFALDKTVSQSDRKHVLQDALKWSGLESLSGNIAKQLSGGEKQRVALARAKLRNAGVLLLDEPTANLDQASRVKTLALLASLKRSGVSLMIACHEHQEFEDISDGILHLDNGLLQKV